MMVERLCKNGRDPSKICRRKDELKFDQPGHGGGGEKFGKVVYCICVPTRIGPQGV